MPRPLATKTVLVVVAWLTAGCEAEPEVGPDFEWKGDRIDIRGFDMQPEDTCAGTFKYLDAYADATAQQFGVVGHLGIYRWYSPERFASEDPCASTALGCAGTNGVFTRIMPLEHEVVHLVSDHVVACPSLITEGLAEYYGTTSTTRSTEDVTELIAQSEHGRIASDGYPLAGAFVAYLVENHGLDAVLSLCETAGLHPSVAEFSSAAQASFGSSLDEILLEFAEFDCVYSEYRAKHFECSQEPDLMVGAEGGEIELEIGCQSPTTIGPRDGEIWMLGLLRVVEPGVYLAQAESGSGVGPEITVELVECAACSDMPRSHRVVADALSDPIQLNASEYIVRVSGAADADDVVTLRLLPL